MWGADILVRTPNLGDIKHMIWLVMLDSGSLTLPTIYLSFMSANGNISSQSSELCFKLRTITLYMEAL